MNKGGWESIGNRRFLMNKRGDEPLLLKQIIEIIIAIVIIVVIVVAAQRFLGTYFSKQKDLQAKGTLDAIVQRLDGLDIGQRDSYVLQAPVGWFIVSYDANNNENNGFVKEQSYFHQNALCICEKAREWVVLEKKQCNICRATKLPLKQGNILAFMEIKIADIWFSNEKDYYNLSSSPTIIPSLSEQEKEDIQTKVTSTNQLITSNNYDAIINDAAKKYYPEVKQYIVNEQELAKTIKAMIAIESTGRWNAIGLDGEVGLIQLMPQTADSLGLKIYDPDNKFTGKGWNVQEKEYRRTTYYNKLIVLKNTKTQQELIAVDDRFDAAKNIDAGTRWLIGYIKELNNKDLGIMAYNAGTSAVKDKCQPLVVTSCKTDFAGYTYLGNIKTALA